MTKPLIVGIGGTTNIHSSTEQALRFSLLAAEEAGARSAIFGSAYLASLPLYLTPGSDRAGTEMIAAIRDADGIIFATPGYHGTVSGLVKNAIDYIEETAKDARTYLDGMPVGLIVTAFGWQATGSTLATMRSIVHALRGWPTPLGAAINTSGGIFRDGVCVDTSAGNQLRLVGQQVTTFAEIRRSNPHMMDTVSTTTG